jgi:probable HAF family extracellular repeat protein
MNSIHILLLACAAGVASAGTIFSVTDLGSLGGTAAQAFALNSAGQVVGASTNTSGYVHAFSNFGNGIRDLTINSAASEGVASGINASGQIVGTQYINGTPVATEWVNGIARPVASGAAYGTAINDAGETTGLLASGDAFVESNGSVVDIGALSRQSWSAGYGINNAGAIAGYSMIAPGVFHAFVWSPATGYTDLGTLGGTNSYAMSINDTGQIAGNAQLASGYSHAVLWSGGVIHDLGTLGLSSYAYGINESGEVVGYSYVDGTEHAFLYTNGVILDLNALIDPVSGWVLNEAYAINAGGQIVGSGLLNGVEHAYRLDYVPGGVRPAVGGHGAITPEPGTWPTLLIGLALVVSRARYPRWNFRVNAPHNCRFLNAPSRRDSHGARTSGSGPATWFTD